MGALGAPQMRIRTKNFGENESAVCENSNNPCVNSSTSAMLWKNIDLWRDEFELAAKFTENSKIY